MILLLSLLATPLSRTEVLEADWVDLADRAAHGEPSAERGLRAWLREAPRCDAYANPPEAPMIAEAHLWLADLALRTPDLRAAWTAVGDAYACAPELALSSRLSPEVRALYARYPQGGVGVRAELVAARGAEQKSVCAYELDRPNLLVVTATNLGPQAWRADGLDLGATWLGANRCPALAPVAGTLKARGYESYTEQVLHAQIGARGATLSDTPRAVELRVPPDQRSITAGYRVTMTMNAPGRYRAWPALRLVPVDGSANQRRADGAVDWLEPDLAVLDALLSAAQTQVTGLLGPGAAVRLGQILRDTPAQVAVSLHVRPEQAADLTARVGAGTHPQVCAPAAAGQPASAAPCRQGRPRTVTLTVETAPDEKRDELLIIDDKAAVQRCGWRSEGATTPAGVATLRATRRCGVAGPALPG